MKPERIEELAREATTWAGGDDFWPVSIAIRTAIMEFADEAASLCDEMQDYVGDSRAESLLEECATLIRRRRDEVLGEDEKISVELRGGPAHKKKSKVQLGSTGLRVPVLRRGGFEQVLYLPTGETNDYGEPIWQAEPPK